MLNPQSASSTIRSIGLKKQQAEELLSWLNKTGHCLLQGIERKVFVKQVCDQVEAWLGSGQAIVLLDKEADRVEVLGSSALTDQKAREIKKAIASSEACVCNQALFKQEPVIISNLEAQDNPPKVYLLFDPLPLQACWAYPLKGENDAVVGALAVVFPTPKKPTLFERTVMEMGATLLSVGLKMISHANTLRHLREHDSLTELHNLTKLEKDAQTLFQMGTSFGLVYIDLDNFQQINDAHGHPVGDQLLVEVARCLERTLIDFPGRLYRGSGDEFYILTQVCELPEPQDAMETLCEKILNTLAAVIHIGHRQLTVSASLGISCSEQANGDFTELLRMADAALAAAKKAGRRKWRFFTEEMTAELEAFLNLESMLHEALNVDDQIDVHYQPILDAKTGQVVIFEALARWHHPVEGDIPPFKFIPVAEKTGLIRQLDEKIVSVVLEDLKQWQQTNPAMEFTVAVNLSAQEFERHHIEALIDMAKKTGLIHRIEFEITESMMMSDTTETQNLIHALKVSGIAGLAMDDFGTGYSSLGYLKKFPVDKLKIDQTLVRDVDTDPQDLAIAKAVALLGRTLGLKVVAEGVETNTHRKILEVVGVDLLQGYLFSRPMRGEAVMPWLESFNTQCLIAQSEAE